MLALKLVAPSRKEPIVLDLTNSEALKTLKKDREFLLLLPSTWLQIIVEQELDF